MPIQEVVYFNHCLLFITMFLPYLEWIFIMLELDEIQIFGRIVQMIDAWKVAGSAKYKQSKTIWKFSLFMQFIQPWKQRELVKG